MTSQRVLPTTKVPQIKFRCTLCGFCCSGYTPLVTSQDIARIQGHLKKPLSSFVAFYRSDDFTVPLEKDERIFITRHGPLAMGIARRDEACVFLKDNLCTIYDTRSGICRSFPFQPVRSGDVEGSFEIQDGSCDGRNGSDEAVAQDAARQDYMAFIYDYYEYIELVSAWNADLSSRVKDVEEFLQYVGLDWQRYETT